MKTKIIKCEYCGKPMLDKKSKQVLSLIKKGYNPSKISKEMKISQPLVSYYIYKLRAYNLVEYNTKGKLIPRTE